MELVNELLIRDEIADAMNADFNDAVDTIVGYLGDDYSKTFTIGEFETTSPEEALRNTEEFGTIYIAKSDFMRVGVLGEKHLTNQIEIEVIVWFLKKGDDINQVSLARMGLVEVMRQRSFAFERFSEWGIESTGSIDFSPDTSENIYTGTGIVVKIKTGV